MRLWSQAKAQSHLLKLSKPFFGEIVVEVLDPSFEELPEEPLDHCSGPLNLDTPLRRGSVQGRGRT